MITNDQLYPAWSTVDSFRIFTIDEAKNIEYKYLIKNKDVSLSFYLSFNFIISISLNLNFIF